MGNIKGVMLGSDHRFTAIIQDGINIEEVGNLEYIRNAYKAFGFIDKFTKMPTLYIDEAKMYGDMIVNPTIEDYVTLGICLRSKGYFYNKKANALIHRFH